MWKNRRSAQPRVTVHPFNADRRQGIRPEPSFCRSAQDDNALETKKHSTEVIVTHYLRQVKDFFWKESEVMRMYVTYQDMLMFAAFVVEVIGLVFAVMSDADNKKK